MFYLKTFFKTMMRHYVIAALWSLSFLTLFGIVFFSEEVSLEIKRIAQVKESKPHFFAMIPNEENVSYLQRKLRALPGVQKVKILSEEKISHQVRKVLGEIDEQNLSSLALDYKGLEVILAQGLQVRTQDLIRTYLKKITSNPSIAMGPVVGASNEKMSFWQKGVVRFGYLVFALAILLFYVLINLFLNNELKKESFYIENFQRKKSVYSKLLVYGHSPLISFLIVGVCLQKQWAEVLLLVLLLSIGLTLVAQKRKYAV